MAAEVIPPQMSKVDGIIRMNVPRFREITTAIKFGGKGLVSAAFKGGRTGFGWFQGGKDWFRLVSGWKGLVSGGFVREGLVSGGFGSFRFLVTTILSFINFYVPVQDELNIHYDFILTI